MNKATYKSMEKAHKALENLFYSSNLDLDELESWLDQARDDWNEKSERWQEGEAGQEEDGRLNELSSAIDEIKALYEARDRAVDHLTSIINDAPEGSFG